MQYSLVVELLIIAMGSFVLLVCGIMESVGTRLPLLILNRVSRWRAILHIFGIGVLHMIGHLLWAGSIWLVLRYLFRKDPDISDTVLLISYSYLPYFFGFLFLLPYLGPWLAFGTSILSLGIAILLVGASYNLSPPQALMGVLAGWTLLRLLERAEARPTRTINDWFWGITTGHVVRQETMPPVLAFATPEPLQPRNEEAVHDR